MSEERKLPELIVTKGGVPFACQAEGVRLFKDACIAASAKVERLARELNITNPDHIALWLDENMADSSIAWLACRIVEAHEEAIRALSKERDMAVEALEKINRIGSPRPDRTLGDCADDLQFIVDIARAALNPGE